jgi:ComF family protein
VGLARVRSAAAGIVGGLLDAVFPPRCLACEEASWDGPLPGLCARCASRLPVIAAPCARCGREAGAHGASAPCPRCRDEEIGVDGVVAPVAYRDVARDLVLALKFGGKTPAAIPLGLLLADACERAGKPGDLVVPVPLSPARFRRRGHNQADEIARVVAARLGLDRDPKALRRHRHGAAQSGRPKAARRRGPDGAYRAERRRVLDRCVLLVDDVVTTGATASACARALRRAGAVRVVLASATRA